MDGTGGRFAQSSVINLPRPFAAKKKGGRLARLHPGLPSPLSLSDIQHRRLPGHRSRRSGTQRGSCHLFQSSLPRARHASSLCAFCPCACILAVTIPSLGNFNSCCEVVMSLILQKKGPLISFENFLSHFHFCHTYRAKNNGMQNIAKQDPSRARQNR